MEFYSEEYLDGLDNGYSPTRWRAFLDTNPSPYMLVLAGKNWPSFNYTAGYNKIIKYDYSAPVVFKAGNVWPDFPYYQAMIFLNRIDIAWGEAIIAAGWPIPEQKRIGILRAFKGRGAVKLLLAGVIDESEAFLYITDPKWTKIINRRKIQEEHGGAKNGVKTIYERKIKGKARGRR